MSEQFGQENHGFPKALAPTKRRSYRKSEAQRVKEATKSKPSEGEPQIGRSDREHTIKALRKRRKALGLKLADEDGTSWKRIKTGWTTAKRQEQNSTKLTTYFKVTKEPMTPAELLEELTASLSDLD